ncbi:thiamine phosphate synthase [Luteimonas aquatica]|uniref:thiamine phosphate synthase n=1 Tax=Luteimonas aquatica TaxID=450364 RepID=UPI001F5AFE9C|nr:thiamine phosphate synthase [Luteimonas aquatica]
MPRPWATAHPSGLYLITPDEPDTARLLQRVRAVLGFATWLQYRNKHADPALRHAQASALLAPCRAAGVPLIVNDDWRLAQAIGADGAHLGEDDGDLRAARHALGETAILGASCYDDPARAQIAVDAGASYVAFGAFFPTRSKSGTRRARPELLREAARLRRPRVAIGGITPDNAGTLIAAGADLVAVISGVFDAADPVAAARAYRACFQISSPPSLPPG